MLYAPTLRSSRHYAPRSLDRNFERLLSNAFRGLPQGGFQEDEAFWTLTLDLPGIAREQLKIDVEGAVVRLETAPEARRSFKAAYELPQDIDAGRTEARLEHGVLTLRLAKPEHQNKAVQIAIA